MTTNEPDTLRLKLAALGEDRALSPYTGWNRQHLAVLADELLMAVRPYANATHSHILIPARDGRGISPIDGLEGFARSFMLAAFRLVGEKGNDPLGLIPWYSQGLAAGVDPNNPQRWPLPNEQPQAKVEAAALVVGLHLTRKWLWDRLEETDQRNVVDYLACVIGTVGPNTNWVWFRLVVEQFLATVGGPYSAEEIREDLQAHESFVREGGWYADGITRAYDYYNSWALQLYPFLWLDMLDADDPNRDRFHEYKDRFDQFLGDAARLVGGDGAPLAQGRSLIYRFAAAAPFWTGAMVGTDLMSLGQLRRAAMGTVKHFVDQGAPDERGLLTLGWFDEWPELAQDYSGTGSPYWAAKGLLGLIFPEDHPVWAATEEPLPIERQGGVDWIQAPGWLLSSTPQDGIVRVYNHGSDHALPGNELSDVDVYAHLAYSTATFPLISKVGDPLPDSSVVVVDPNGHSSHRSGFELISGGTQNETAFAFSRWKTRWIDVAEGQKDYGNGFVGVNTYGPALTVGSIIRGEWEVRLILIEPGADTFVPVSVVVTGWPVTGQVEIDAEQATAASGAIRSRIVGLAGLPETGVQRSPDSTPLPGETGTPWVAVDAAGAGRWLIAASELSGAAPTAPPLVRTEGDHVMIEWPDGYASLTRLPEHARL
ncbi:DUF2264 domain-containing protein [Arthrobacter sp. YN]|uniref:DUF2264 domain-containing protein n=1 Tax=Arthrobacter sp. YN TaxID=2020486 RepID=UPI000B5EC572|nr:DUF2264 domain-containing protein [Arthrobacter sp. YN]ASN22076.1 hypothetical protein CGK93_22240 [Arthrobacter sp. YN]